MNNEPVTDQHLPGSGEEGWCSLRWPAVSPLYHSWCWKKTKRQSVILGYEMQLTTAATLEDMQFSLASVFEWIYCLHCRCCRCISGKMRILWKGYFFFHNVIQKSKPSSILHSYRKYFYNFIIYFIKTNLKNRRQRNVSIQKSIVHLRPEYFGGSFCTSYWIDAAWNGGDQSISGFIECHCHCHVIECLLDNCQVSSHSHRCDHGPSNECVKYPDDPAVAIHLLLQNKDCNTVTELMFVMQLSISLS